MNTFARVSRGLKVARSCRTRSSRSEDTPLRRLLDEASAFNEGAATEPELRWATQPYAVRPNEGDTNKARVEPSHTTVLLFPGQGSQHVGMGKKLMHLPPVRELYELASSIVGWDVARVCTEGPEEELSRHCQIATLVTSLASLERLRDERPSALERVRAAAGFSLGEITALTFAGALTLEGALRLVDIRAAAMRACSQERRGGMLTVWLGADANLSHALLRAREHAAECGVAAPVCRVANYLYPGCKVVAGDEEALRFVERRGPEFGVRRAARVRVEGAFHTELMARAEDAVRAALHVLQVAEPRVRVVSAVDARPYRDARHVRAQLARHVTRPVRWEQTLHVLYARPRDQHVPLTVTLGPAAALRSTLRQVNARAWDSSLQIQV